MAKRKTVVKPKSDIHYTKRQSRFPLMSFEEYSQNSSSSTQAIAFLTTQDNADVELFLIEMKMWPSYTEPGSNHTLNRYRTTSVKKYPVRKTK